MLHYEQQAVSANDFPFLSLLQACSGSGTALQHAILTCAVKKGCLLSAFVGQSFCFNTLDCQFTLCSDYPYIHIHTTVKINMYLLIWTATTGLTSIGLFSCIV